MRTAMVMAKVKLNNVEKKRRKPFLSPHSLEALIVRLITISGFKAHVISVEEGEDGSESWHVTLKKEF